MNIYIYKKPENLQKARQFALRFIHKKPYTLGYAIFHEIFVFHIYLNTKKHVALRYMTFLNTKSKTLREK